MSLTTSPAAVKNIECQALLSKSPDCHGWIRRKSKFQQLGQRVEDKLKIARSQSVVSKMSWKQRYAVVSECKMYVFAEELARQAQKVLDLSIYNKVSKADEEKTKDVLYAFKLEPSSEVDSPQNHSFNIQYFSVISEDERNKWMSSLNREINRLKRPQPSRRTDGPELPKRHPDKKNSKSEDLGTFDDTYEEIEDAMKGGDSSTGLWNGTPDEAKRVMFEINKEGVYLIRKACDSSGYTLMVVAGGKLCKFKISEGQVTKKLTSVDHCSFDNLSDLIRHYSSNNLPNKTIKLTEPYTAYWCVGQNEDDVEYTT
jgi:hypothetical protein